MSFQFYAHPMVLPSSASKFASNDAWAMLEKRWDHIRNEKSDCDRTKTKHLPLSQKNRLRLEFPNLRLSHCVTLFLIKFRVDWCLRHAREMVRSYTKCKKWRQPNKMKHLPLSQKNGSRHESPTLRQSNGITVFLIKFRVDWCLSHARATVRTHTKCKIVTTKEQNETLTSVTKKQTAARVPNSTPLQWYHCLPHQIPRRLMPKPCTRNGQNAYEM